MNRCPKCQSQEEQIKNGLNPSGSQRYQCRCCGRVYTPKPTRHGYAEEIRQQAITFYLEGMNLRRIARLLKVNHQSVANWVNEYAQRLPPAPVPSEPEVIELDELFTFIAKKSPHLPNDSR